MGSLADVSPARWTELEALPRSKAEAKAAGSKLYFTGQLCVRRHFSARRTWGGHCCQCLEVEAEQRRAAKAAPKDEAKADALVKKLKVESDKLNARLERQDARKAATRAARLERANERQKAKAAATRAANKAAREAVVRATEATTAPPWDDEAAPVPTTPAEVSAQPQHGQGHDEGHRAVVVEDVAPWE